MVHCGGQIAARNGLKPEPRRCPGGVHQSPAGRDTRKKPDFGKKAPRNVSAAARIGLRIVGVQGQLTALKGGGDALPEQSDLDPWPNPCGRYPRAVRAAAWRSPDYA